MNMFRSDGNRSHVDGILSRVLLQVVFHGLPVFIAQERFAAFCAPNEVDEDLYECMCHGFPLF